MDKLKPPKTLPDEKESLSKNVKLLIVFRFCLIIFLFIISLNTQSSFYNSFNTFQPSNAISLVSIAGFWINIFHLILLKHAVNRLISLETLAKLQVFFDILLITFLVYTTGGIVSIYVTLYYLLIAASGVILSSRSAHLTSISTAVIYTFTVIWQSLNAPQDQTVPLTLIGQSVGFNDLSFLFVGLLAAKLSAKQSLSYAKYTEASKRLVKLRAFHERIIESIKSGLVTADTDGKIYTANSSASEITGYEIKDFIGKDASTLFKDFLINAQKTLNASEKNSSQTYRYETLIKHAKTGENLLLGYGIFPIYDEKKVCVGYVVTFYDLREVKALEEKEKRKDKLAAIGRVSAGIAHEIRNPLAAMRGAVQILGSNIEKGTEEEILMEIILTESDRLNRIITDFLTYSKPQAPNLKKEDIKKVLSETMTFIKMGKDVKPVHKIEENYPDFELLCDFDSSQLKQVFWNLAKNALQSMPEGGTLKVSLKTLPNEKMLKIEFSDTGLGISPDQIEHIFEPFVSTKIGGTGLGLSTVHQIITDHNGDIKVESSPNNGSTFTILLPLQTTKPADIIELG